MIRGFIDQSSSPNRRVSKSHRPELRLGAVAGVQGFVAMRSAWRALASKVDHPGAQYEWAEVAIARRSPHMEPLVLYATDGHHLRGLVPLMRVRNGPLEHLEGISGHIAMPWDLLYSDHTTLEALTDQLLAVGCRVKLSHIFRHSPFLELIRRRARLRKIDAFLKKAPASLEVNCKSLPMETRADSSARTSILAASFGMAGGPHDVIFSIMSPTMAQISSMCRETEQLGLDAHERQSHSESNDFLRDFAHGSCRLGQIRLANIYMSGRAIASQIFYIQHKSAWLLKASHLGKRRGEPLTVVLLAEAMRTMRQENVERVYLPCSTDLPEFASQRKVPLVDVRIYPHRPGSMAALTLRKIRRRLLGSPSPDDTMNHVPMHRRNADSSISARILDD